jgi:5-methylcytosine-specific restriction endonuclease McrA
VSKKEFYLRSWLISQLRNIFRRYPPFYNTRNRVKSEFTVMSKSGKPMRRVQFECAQCHKKVSSKEIRIDHTIPVVGVEGFPLNSDGTDNWGEYINRMFCPPENLSPLCNPCHDAKTAVENAGRTKVRKKRTKKLI